jgi:translation initiation factor 2 subunit 1
MTEIDNQINLKCRMYENKYPEIDELVTVRVTKMEDLSVSVILLEYNDIEGMVLLSELTNRRRVRSICKLATVGKQETMVTLRVDPTKGYVDLSKRRITPDEIAKQDARFIKSKTVHNIMCYVATTTNTDLEVLYEMFGWSLYKKFNHAYDAFKIAVTDPDSVFHEYNLPENILNCLLIQIRHRLTSNPVRICAEFELICFDTDGANIINEVLSESYKIHETNDVKLKISVISPPLYTISTITTDKTTGIKCIKKTFESINNYIIDKNGEFFIKSDPRIIGDDEDMSKVSTNIETSDDDL